MVVLFEILGPPAFPKNSTCWVFSAHCLCLCLCHRKSDVPICLYRYNAAQSKPIHEYFILLGSFPLSLSLCVSLSLSELMVTSTTVDRQGEYRAICLWKMDWQSFAKSHEAMDISHTGGGRAFHSIGISSTSDNFPPKYSNLHAFSRVCDSLCWEKSLLVVHRCGRLTKGRHYFKKHVFFRALP